MNTTNTGVVVDDDDHKFTTSLLPTPAANDDDQHDDDDICSVEYFHGLLDRQTAESLLKFNGQFLLRESGTKTGQYILSCMVNDQYLHFLIHENVIKSTNTTTTDDVANAKLSTKKQYSFERQWFDSIRQLIEHHLTTQQPLTVMSNVRIVEPVLRIKQPNHSSSLSSKSSTINNNDNNDGDSDGIDQMSCIHFSTKYLQQIQNSISAIELEVEQLNDISDDEINILKHSHNIPDEHELCCDLIAQTPAQSLAENLFRRNLSFIGGYNLDETKDYQEPLRSGIELMCLPTGKQMRRDLIIRHECLKYFVVRTILISGGSTDQHRMLAIFRKWIQVCGKLLDSFGDYFGFGALMSGLSHNAVKRLWQESLAELTHYDSELRELFADLLRGKVPPSINTTIPFVIQLCHMLECSSIVNQKLLPLCVSSTRSLPDMIATECAQHDKIGLKNFALDNILAHIYLSANLMDNLARYEHNAKVALMVNSTTTKQQHKSSATVGGDDSNNCDIQNISTSSPTSSILWNVLFVTKYHIRFIFHKSINVITEMNHLLFQQLEFELAYS